MYYLLAFVLVIVFYSPGISYGEKVVLQLKWYHQFQFAGYYAAQEKGFYEAEGLDVEIREPRLDQEPVEEVLSHRAQYGVSNSELLLHRLQNKPVVVLAVIFQHSPLVFVARKNAGVTHPQDLSGKTVMMTRKTRDIELHATLLNEGVSLDRVHMVVPDTINLETYLNPKFSALSAYITNEPYLYEKAGVPYIVIQPLTYGIDFYGDCLFTTEDEIEKHPDRVRRFRQASLEGWRYAMTHQEELIDIILKKYHAKKSRDHLQFEAKAMEKLILPDLVEMGHMNPGRWIHIGRTFARFGLVAQDFNIDGFIYNPDAPPDYRWLKVTVVVIAVLALISLIITGFLWTFNQRLQNEIQERNQVESALRENEQKYRFLFNSIPNGIVLVENLYNSHGALCDFRYLEMNPAFEEIIGVASKYAIGKTATETMPETDQSWFHILDQVVKSGNLQRFEKFHQGIGKYLDVSAYPPDKNRLIIIIQDITGRKRHEKEKEEFQNKLNRYRKMEALGLLAGGVAHDLNNILSGIVSLPDLILMDENLNANQRRAIESMQKSGLRAVAVIDDLLTITRGVACQKDPMNLNPLIEDYLNSPEFVSVQNRYPRVQLDVQLAPDLLNIKGSQIHIRKALMNLIINAFEAVIQLDTDAGIVRIETYNKYLDRPIKGYDQIQVGEYVVLSVFNKGPGISPEDMERIFEPFYTKKVMGRSGTGLGLTVVWNTIQDHHGYIDVESSQEETEFRLFFPVYRGEIQKQSEKIKTDIICGHGEVILVVDDEASQRNISCQLLEFIGYQAEAVENGQQAIEFVKRKKVDLVLLDMILGQDMNGRQVYEQLIRFQPGIKAVIASGYSETEEVRKTQALGAGCFIRKPYTLKKLGLAIQSELKKC